MYKFFHLLITIKKKYLEYLENKPISTKIKLEDVYDKLLEIEFKQNLIMDYFMNPADAKQATGVLRQRQLLNLELLKEFVRICEMHNIDYWLDFGSLLGARRHSGAIPWDDDIDVSVKREDIPRLKKACLECLNKENFYFWDTKVESLFRICYKGYRTFLDIFPYRRVQRDIIQLEQKLPLPGHMLPVSKDLIFPLTEIIFENIKVKAPNKIDEYLTIRYGDFMKLPKHEHVIKHSDTNEIY